jgi:hypothetical protein
MLHVEFNNTALDLLDVDHVWHFRTVKRKAVGRYRRPLTRGGAIRRYGLQLLCKPVHSLNYTVVAANKVRHGGIGKPRL